MEAVPRNIDLQRVSDDIRRIPRVKEIHDLHIWSIASDVCALSSHIVIDTEDVNALNSIIGQINEMLKVKYNITHSVIQAECDRCASETNCGR